MTLLRTTAHFEAPIERVYELLIDYKRYPEWNVSYEEIKEVTGPIDKVGTRIHAIMKLLGRHMEGWAEVVELERPRLVKLSGTGDKGGKLTVTYHLTPSGMGTDVEFLSDYELPAGLFGAVVDKLFVEKTVERDLKHSTENFKAFIETKVPVLA